MSEVFEAYREPEAVEASHLVRTPCVACRAAYALADPGQVATARCARCHGGSVVVAAGSVAWAPVMGYALQRQAARMVEERSAYPSPVVTSRDVVSGGEVAAPSAVAKLAQEAREASWVARVQRSRGCLSNRATGRPGAVRDVFAVKGWRVGWGFYAVYVGAAWESVMMWGEALSWFPTGSVTDLRQFLAEPGRPAEWFDAIRVREAAKAAKARERAKVAPRREREGMR